MNFDFSEEQRQLQSQIRRLFAERCSAEQLRAVIDNGPKFDRSLWTALADMGVFFATIPEEHGGLGLGHLEACLLAEEIGRAIAPLPYSMVFGFAAECLIRLGTEDQKDQYLPRLGAGTSIAAYGEGALDYAGGLLRGNLHCVIGGSIADILVARAGDRLFLVNLSESGVCVEAAASLDLLVDHADISLTGVPAAPMMAPGNIADILTDIRDCAVVLTAFEQLGGADRCSDMARAYALERMAFGRPIGSFQAIKHRLADMYVKRTLARSNCYFAAWALSTCSNRQGLAAAIARVSASQAYLFCARENIQVHGGIGFTWEVDCHLHYRRANSLALVLGGSRLWEGLLIERLERNTHEF